MKIVLETALVEAASTAWSWKRKRWGASPAVRIMGQGDKAARSCPCAAVLVPFVSLASADAIVPQAAATNARGRVG